MSLKKYSLLIIVFCLTASFYITVHNAFYTPSVNAIDLSPILTKSTLTDEDYALIYTQTGIAKPLTQELQTMPHFTEKMLKFQANYLRKKKVRWLYIFPVTFEERLIDQNGLDTIGFELGPYHNGYILFTKAAHSAFWHHGHCGLVVDEAHGKTLEAIHMGSGCALQNISKWQYYPTFKMMRLKNTSLEQLNRISHTAYANLQSATYHLLAQKDSDSSLIPTKTQCALLIWQAFYQFGYDLDAQDGLFVTPKSLASSPLLEVLQIYGFNPEKVW